MHQGATCLVLVEAERRMEENRRRDRSRDEENRKEAFPFLVFGSVVRIQLIEPILNLPPSIAESHIAIGFVQCTTSQGSILSRESLQSSLRAPWRPRSAYRRPLHSQRHDAWSRAPIFRWCHQLH